MIVGCGAANRLFHYLCVLSLVWGQGVRRPEYFNLNKMNEHVLDYLYWCRNGTFEKCRL